MLRQFWPVAVYNQDQGNGGAAGGGAGGGAGSGDTAGNGAGQGGAGGAGGQQGGAGGAGGAGGGAADWFPAGLDAKLKGKDAGETLTNVAKHLSEMPKAPAEAKDYAFTPDEKLGRFFQNPADSKVLDVARGVAHELGLTNQQFAGFINKFYGAALEKGVIGLPVDPADEFKALGGTEGTPKEIAERGEARFFAMRDRINGLETAGILNKGEAAELVGEFGSAKGVLAMERLLKHIETVSGGEGPGNGGQGAGDGLTDHERRVARMYPTMVIK